MNPQTVYERRAARAKTTTVSRPCKTCGSFERYASVRSCVRCCKARAQKRYSAKSEEILARAVETQKRYCATLAGRLNRLFTGARGRAKAQALAFSLSKEWITERLVAGVCEKTGLPFSFDPAGSNAARNPWSPSIDRIDPTMGYTEENCRRVIWAYNVAKGPWADAIVLAVAKALVS